MKLDRINKDILNAETQDFIHGMPMGGLFKKAMQRTILLSEIVNRLGRSIMFRYITSVSYLIGVVYFMISQDWKILLTSWDS